MPRVKKQPVPETSVQEEGLGLEALSDKLLVKKIDLEAKSKGGIILAEVEKDREVVYCLVLDAGPGFRQPNGETAPMAIKVGDIVAARQMIPLRANFKGEYVWIMREQDVLFRVKDKNVVVKPYELEGYEFDNKVQKMK